MPSINHDTNFTRRKQDENLKGIIIIYFPEN